LICAFVCSADTYIFTNITVSVVFSTRSCYQTFGSNILLLFA